MVNSSWYEITPLVIAIWKVNLALVNLLLESGANPDRKMSSADFHMLSKLKQAGKNQGHSTQTLRRRDISFADISSNSSFTGQTTALYPKLAQLGHKNTLSSPIDFNNKNCILPFEQAIRAGNIDICKLILSKYNSPNIRTDLKLVAESTNSLSSHCDLNLAMILLKMGADKTQRDTFGCTPLHLAARSGDLDLCILYTSASTINQTGLNGWFSFC